MHKSNSPAVLVGSTLKIILSILQPKELHEDARLEFIEVWKTLEYLKVKQKQQQQHIT